MARHPASSDVFSAIADPTRRALMDALVDGEQSVGVLAAQFESTLSAISQHLRILRDAGLVIARTDGRQRMYWLDATRLKEVSDWVSFYEKFWQKKLDNLDKHLKGKKRVPRNSD